MDTRLVIETAMDDRATSVVLAHNHVSGLAVPSEADVKLTLQLIPLLRALDIELLDHLVVADGEFVSMVRSGLIRAAAKFRRLILTSNIRFYKIKITCLY